MPARTCPKCAGRMTSGSVIGKDTNGGYGDVVWVEGAPEKSIWTGLRLRGRTLLSVVSFRCERCGFLENYAEHLDNPIPPG